MKPPESISLEIGGTKYRYVLATNTGIISQRQKTAFRNILAHAVCEVQRLPKQYHPDYETQLKELANLTEPEFYTFRGVGKNIAEYAKKEMEKVGLKFKES